MQSAELKISYGNLTFKLILKMYLLSLLIYCHSPLNKVTDIYIYIKLSG